MDFLQLVFGIVGGLGLFIYGIKMMGDGLQKFAGDSMKKILEKLTSNRLMGVMVGALVTAIVQSSSATTVMVVGFVNAGLMNLVQAVSVIIGANIGTTITGQLIAFKLTKYALPIIGIGAALMFYGKTKKQKQIGEFLFGFGILFLGLDIMGKTVKPYGQTEFVKNVFITFGKNPILGVIAGMIVTMFVQSSSVTVGLTITLASAGLIPLNSAIPIILGDNIGTCITAFLASINTNTTAKKAAWGHILFNVIGTVIVLLLLPLYGKLIVMTSTDIARQVANSHTLFNIINTIIFIPFIPLFARLLDKLIPTKQGEIEPQIKYLDKNLLVTPNIALAAATKEIVRMTHICKDMLNDSLTVLMKWDDVLSKKTRKNEAVVDMLQDEISRYLVKLTEKELSQVDSSILPAMLHSVNDLERIGDHATNIIELSEKMRDKKLKFSPAATKDIRKMSMLVNEMFDDIIFSLKNKKTSKPEEALEKEEKINKLTKRLRDNHTCRLKDNVCTFESGFIFLDIVMNLEKIGDHLANIAEAKKDALVELESLKRIK